jgi:hypothetical protein
MVEISAAPAATWRRIGRTGVYLAGGIVLLIGLLNFIAPGRLSIATNSWSIDFDINWIAARQLVDHGSLYDRHEALRRGIAELGPVMKGTNYGTFWSYIGSPPIALSHVPFLPFGHDSGLHLFRIATLFAMIAAVILTGWTLPGRSRPLAILVGLGSLFFAFPTIKTLALGQGNGWVMLALAVGIWGCARERWGVAGVGLGVATVLKISPGLLVLYLLLRGRRRAVWSACATAAVWLGASALAGRPDDLVTWARDVAPRVSKATVSAFNQSIVGAAGRLTTHLDFESGRAPGHWYLLGYAVAVIGVLALWWTRRGRATVDPLDLGILVLVALLAGPLTWDHYLVWAIVPLVLIVDPARWRGRTPVEGLTLGFMIAAGVYLLNANVPLPTPAEVRADWWLRLASDRYTLSLLLFLCVGVILLLHEPRRAPPEAPTDVVADEAAESHQLVVVTSR